MSYYIEWGRDCVHVKYTGDITSDDVLEVWGKILGNNKYDSLKYITKNFLDISSLNVSEVGFKVLYNFIKTTLTWKKDISLSIIFKENEIPDKGLMNISLLRSFGWNINHFTSLEESTEWCKQQ